MTSYKCLLYEMKDGVATLTLNRPERLNALGDTLRDDLQDAVTRASDDPEVRVMIVTGAGKGFCSGGDVKAMSERKESGSGRPLMEKVAPGRDRTESRRRLRSSHRRSSSAASTPTGAARTSCRAWSAPRRRAS